MPTYMAQATFTAEAWKRFTEAPHDRGQMVATQLEKLGCRLLSFHFSFGETDTVTIFEAPDDTTAAAASLSFTSAGHLKGLKTTKLMTVKEAMEAARKAGQAPFKPMG